jgi:CheY-like chemotaxis protein
MASQQAELAERNADLISASRLKSEFLATMSHELRTPLNAVIGFAEVLLAGDGDPLTASQAAHARDILDAGQQLLILLNDVLDLTRIEAGRLQIRVADLDLLVPANQAREMIAPLVRERRVSVDIRLDRGAAMVAADPDRVRQVLLNLLTNAVKFTPPGGRVTLEGEAGGRQLRVRVTDTGIGIDRGDLDKLFQPFTQIETGMARKHGGTGLGLAISRQLVEAMGGTIGCESVPGQGSTFWFTLPLAADPVTSPRLPDAAPPPPPPPRVNTAPVVATSKDGRLHLLIVDDNAANRRVIRSMLASLPYDLSEAADAPTAIAMARELAPHVILMDLQMPGMDGLTATRVLAGDATTARIPVLAVTAHAMLGDAERARDAGCVGYLAKPVGREGLLSAIVAAAKVGEERRAAS